MFPTVPSPGRLLWLTVAVAGLYLGAAEIAFHAAVVAGAACPVWPAAAVGLVATIRLGRAALPGIVLGSLVAELLQPIPALAVVLIVAGGALGPLVSVWVLRRRRVDTGLGSAGAVVAFAAAVAAGAAVSAAAGAGGLLAAGVLDGAQAPQTAVLWWLGNLGGALCAAPLLLVRRGPGHASAAEAALAVGTAAAVGVLVLGTGDAQVYAVFPVLIWAGLRLGPQGAAGTTLVLATLTVASTARGRGPFVQDTVAASLLTAQGFLLVTALTTLLLAAITDERHQALERLARSERRRRALYDEQAALRRVAEAAAQDGDPATVCDLAARELGQLLGTEVAVVLHFDAEDSAAVHGQWSILPAYAGAGSRLPVAEGDVACEVRRGLTVRRDERAGTQSSPPLRQRIGAPVVVSGRVWGAVVVATTARTALPDAAEEQLGRFAGLVALAVANGESRAHLTAQATTDPLTGLLNHRSFHERLRAEVGRAQRHGRALSVAVFDIDHFKAVNDACGHAAGDRVLLEAARRLLDTARAEDAVGRVGGDEIAVIMPEVDGVGAFAATDRMRRAIGTGGYGDLGPLTASAGTCDLTLGEDAEGLLRLADGALYWAKAHGRDVTFRYQPDIVEELSAAERADRLARSKALSGVRALARAIDVKDPSTTEHSERVADLSGRLAQAAGWEPARVALLREAALVHDVGKIGVPDRILFKRGRLNGREMVHVRRHAELGAQIASEVLGPEQADWIRFHHERHDGRGYPTGLAGDDIPEGARLLALADAWDAMTRARVYHDPIPAELALAEVRAERGRQFAPEAVDLLAGLWAAGGLGACAPLPVSAAAGA